MGERDAQAKAARETSNALTTKQKELDLLNKHQIDLGRQVRRLLWELSRVQDPTLPDEDYSDEPPTEGVLDSDAFVSSNLVLFKNLPHLQEQNQMLLKLTRSLGAQLEERDKKAAADEESELMSEARQLIENLQSELNASRSKMEAYVRERDTFRSMLGRQQNGQSLDASAYGAISEGGPDYHRMYDDEHAQLESLRKQWNEDTVLLRDEVRQAKAEAGSAHASLARAKAEVEFVNGMSSLLTITVADRGLRAIQTPAKLHRFTNSRTYIIIHPQSRASNDSASNRGKNQFDD